MVDKNKSNWHIILFLSLWKISKQFDICVNFSSILVMTTISHGIDSLVEKVLPYGISGCCSSITGDIVFLYTRNDAIGVATMDNGFTDIFYSAMEKRAFFSWTYVSFM